MQGARTSELIFSVPRLIAEPSSAPLLPGDVIFTGSPPGSASSGDRTGFCGPVTS